MNLPGYEWLKERLQSEEGRQRIAAVEKLTVIARELGMSVTQLALAWCLKNPYVSSVILGASRLQQLSENLGALAHVPKLTSEVMARIEAGSTC